jgi:hypothetical protein
VFGNFRDLRPILPYFRIRSLQSLTSPKSQYESRSSNVPVSPSSPSPQAQTDLYTTDADHANAMQADWKARRSRIPNVVRHDQCNLCRKISNHDPLRARRQAKVHFWEKWGSRSQNESHKTYSQSQLRLVNWISIAFKFCLLAYSSFMFLDSPAWNHKSCKTRYHTWPFGWPADASSWEIQWIPVSDPICAAGTVRNASSL